MLNGLEGRKSGTIEGYNYTEANKNSGITLGRGRVPRIHQGPAREDPGTKMVFAGIKSENEIKSLWAYLKQFDAEGKKK